MQESSAEPRWLRRRVRRQVTGKRLVEAGPSGQAVQHAAQRAEAPPQPIELADEVEGEDRVCRLPPLNVLATSPDDS